MNNTKGIVCDWSESTTEERKKPSRWLSKEDVDTIIKTLIDRNFDDDDICSFISNYAERRIFVTTKVRLGNTKLIIFLREKGYVLSAGYLDACNKHEK